MAEASNTHVVVMGVSGAGKSTVARALADCLRWVFAEGDDFHPVANVAKMTAGVPLTDIDRTPWLEALASWTRDQDAAGLSTVLSCSALRRRYRDILGGGLPGTFFVHLTVGAETLLERMAGRAHFMPTTLLQSQLDTLETLEPDEPGLAFDATLPQQELVGRIVAALRLGQAK